MMLIPKDLLAKVKEKVSPAADKPISEEGRHVELVGRILLVVAVVAAAAFMLFYHPKAHAKPVAQVAAEGAVITVYDEECRLKDGPSNMPLRITWRDKNGLSEGCFMVRPDMGVVLAFFASDRTVAVIPMQHFRALTEASM